MDLEQARAEITKQLNNYPVYEAVKTARGYYSLLYMGLVVLCMVLANYVLLWDSTGLIEAAENAEWWNYALAILAMIGMILFSFKAFSIPSDINFDLKAADLKKVLMVSEYNPLVKAYIQNKLDLTMRDYYYLNIDEQLTVINNIKGMAALKREMGQEPQEVLPELSHKLQAIKLEPFMSQKDLMGLAAKKMKQSIVCLGLFVGVLLVAAFVDIQFTPFMRGMTLLISFSLFVTMFLFFFSSLKIRAIEKEYLDSDEYSSLIDVCAHSPESRHYIANVIQEGRSMNKRDWDALQVGRQLHKINYAKLASSIATA